MRKDAVGIGLVGLGTIGTGVVKVLQQNAEVISERLGFPLRLVRIADLDLELGKEGGPGFVRSLWRSKGKLRRSKAAFRMIPTFRSL